MHHRTTRSRRSLFQLTYSPEPGILKTQEQSFSFNVVESQRKYFLKTTRISTARGRYSAASTITCFLQKYAKGHFGWLHPSQRMPWRKTKTCRTTVVINGFINGCHWALALSIVYWRMPCNLVWSVWAQGRKVTQSARHLQWLRVSAQSGTPSWWLSNSWTLNPSLIVMCYVTKLVKFKLTWLPVLLASQRLTSSFALKLAGPMNKFFCPLLEKFCPLFKHFA